MGDELLGLAIGSLFRCHVGRSDKSGSLPSDRCPYAHRTYVLPDCTAAHYDCVARGPAIPESNQSQISVEWRDFLRDTVSNSWATRRFKNVYEINLVATPAALAASSTGPSQ